MPSVSVIIPIYNSAKTIRRAVESALNNNSVKEVILIEDGSSDESLEKCKELIETYPLLKLLTHEDGINKGANVSRNLGLYEASGEWIQFLDADDELLNNKIDHQIKLVKNNPSSNLVIGNYVYIKAKSQLKIKSNLSPWLGLIDSNLGITSANLWKTDAIRRVGGWETALTSSQEYDLIFRLMQNNPLVIYDDAFLTKIHAAQNSISRSKNRIQENTINRLKLRIEIRDYLKKNNLLTIDKKLFLDGFIGRNVNYLKREERSKFKFNPLLFSMYKLYLRVNRLNII
ncbi:glycosyltransferase family 2 protein [Pontibacter sp. JH31]|uniref:Glycosyltransferase family 2 protein n=1 Tax=Pontibacter aquaedesilientis TaxID=2766980 RepID=A0ABR7XF80_9BACT|nr:glycosyltransferase family A protein [Pontibacter aquaedesilientis]MBD1396951.1 glycosyltransferase family 2 protein [Pontibacter aquaedesilientis]